MVCMLKAGLGDAQEKDEAPETLLGEGFQFCSSTGLLQVLGQPVESTVPYF